MAKEPTRSRSRKTDKADEPAKPDDKGTGAADETVTNETTAEAEAPAQEPTDDNIPVKAGKGGTFRMVKGKRVRTA